MSKSRNTSTGGQKEDVGLLPEPQPRVVGSFGFLLERGSASCRSYKEWRWARRKADRAMREKEGESWVFTQRTGP